MSVSAQERGGELFSAPTAEMDKVVVLDQILALRSFSSAWSTENKDDGDLGRIKAVLLRWSHDVCSLSILNFLGARGNKWIRVWDALFLVGCDFGLLMSGLGQICESSKGSCGDE